MFNRYAANLVTKASERFSNDSVGMSMSEWICKNTTLKKRPFSFYEHEFQRQIVDDMHHDLSVIKISQVGLTEVQIRKALGFLKRNRGTSLIFSLPNEDMFERISKGRVKPIINEDKVFTTPEDIANKSVRSTEMMQFGSSFLYLVPAIEQAATSISADFVMNDEIDLSDQKMISLFQSRLQHSKYKISQKFSTPSFPLYGIDSNWQLSDQHLYMCKCDKCNHWNHPEFNRKFVHIPDLPEHINNLTDITKEFQDDIDFSQAYVMCEKCFFPLDLRSPEKREWVATYPTRKDNRGYQITPFVTDNLSLPYIFKQLWEYQKNDYLRGFYNTVLGLPYSDGNIQIPIQDIHACMTNEVSPPDLSKYENLWIGIDVGTICHVTIGSGYNQENIDIISIYQVHSSNLVEHCRELCEKYKVRGGCIDRHPYTPTANDVFAASKGVIIPVEYRGLKEIGIIKDEYDVVTHAQVNRTSFLDTLASKIRKHKIRISGYGHYKQVFVEHLRDMVRSETPEKQAEWVKLHGNDHYFHSSAFMLLAPALVELIRLKSDGEVRTSIMSITTNMKSNVQNLIGIKNKKLDKIIITR
mgnify:FL=1